MEGDSGGSADGCVGRVESEHATRDTVEDRLGADEHEDESLTELRAVAARDPTTNGILDPRLHLSKAEQRDLVQPLLGGCCAIGGSLDCHVEAPADHNIEVVRMLERLGSNGAGRRAVLRAIAEKQGVTDEDEIEREKLAKEKADAAPMDDAEKKPLEAMAKALSEAESVFPDKQDLFDWLQKVADTLKAQPGNKSIDLLLQSLQKFLACEASDENDFIKKMKEYEANRKSGS